MSEEDKEVAHCVRCGLLVRVSFRCNAIMVLLFACCTLMAHTLAFYCQAFARLLAASSDGVGRLIHAQAGWDRLAAGSLVFTISQRSRVRAVPAAAALLHVCAPAAAATALS